MIELIPNENKHFKNIKTGDIAEGIIYLGKYDSAENYVEVDEYEYQEWLKKKNEEINER